MDEVFNFSAGPSMLPREVMYQIKEEFHNWHNLGLSVMEISHRSIEFSEIVQQLECNLRNLLDIPGNYEILFCHGGGRTQFSSIPMNLLSSSDSIPDYVNSGYWSQSAAREAKKYCVPNVINVNVIEDSIRFIKDVCFWGLSDSSAYLHYCPNETIDGIAIREIPNVYNNIIVGDFSSTLLSEPLNISKFGVVYAAAQKNIGIPGLTVVIIREDLLLKSYSCFQIPSTLQYSVLAKYQSLYNTPVTFSWYIAGLVFEWIKNQGGLLEIAIRNKKKASLLYKTIDENDCYYNNIALTNRSYMNVVFHLYDQKLNKIFLKQAEDTGLYALKGHKVVGGMRASLYNAMPLRGVQVLTEFMIEFSRRYG